MSDENPLIAHTALSAVSSSGNVANEITANEYNFGYTEAGSKANIAPSDNFIPEEKLSQDKYVAYTIKLPADQLAALQSIWLELKRLYGTHSPDKSGMIQLAVEEWLKRWDGADRDVLLESLLQIRADTRRRQYKKSP